MRRPVLMVLFGLASLWLAANSLRSDEPKAPDAKPAEEKKEEPKPGLVLDVPEKLDAVIEKAATLKVSIKRKAGYDKPFKVKLSGAPGGKPLEQEVGKAVPQPTPKDEVVNFTDLTFDKVGDSELTIEAEGDGVKSEPAKVKVVVVPLKIDVADAELVANKALYEIKAYRKKGEAVELVLTEVGYVGDKEVETPKGTAKIEKDDASVKVDLKYAEAGTYNLRITPKGGKAEDAATVKITIRAPDPTGEKTGNRTVVSFTPPDLSDAKPKKIDTEKLPPDVKKAFETSEENTTKQEGALAKVTDGIGSLADIVGKNRVALNLMWTLLAGFLVMFMQTGFAMVETGLTRAKNVAHTMAMNIMVYGTGMLGFWVCGFALMFGGTGNYITGSWGGASLLDHEYTVNFLGKTFGLFGHEGFFLKGTSYDVGILALFLFQMVFMDTAATIPTGALAERWKFLAFVVYGFVISMVIYPIYGNWVWGGGWLSQLGLNFQLGHGHVDFAGSSVVHMVGGVSALAGILVLGPRLGKYNKDGSVNALPAHNVPMYVVGTLILAFGWFGFNPGSALQFGNDFIAARCAVNTMLASAAGAVSAMTYMWLVYKKPDPSFMCNGMLAGLVAITAPCAFVAPWAAVVIGGIAGVLVIWSCVFWEKIAKVDDPVGAVSVHGVNGAWGVISIGIFADGTYGGTGATWNNVASYPYWWKLPDGTLKFVADKMDTVPDGWVPQGVTGLLYGNTGQLWAELIGVGTNIIWVFGTAYLAFWIIELLIGNRVTAEVEEQGLDIHEMGVPGYINEDPKVPEGHVLHAGAEPKRATVPGDGKGHFTVVVQGIDPGSLAQTWSQLCLPSKAPPKEFLTVYRNMTTLQGTRFRFRGGDPEQMRTCMEQLLQANGNGKTVRTSIEG